jgi:hypothetical protein
MGPHPYAGGGGRGGGALKIMVDWVSDSSGPGPAVFAAPCTGGGDPDINTHIYSLAGEG